MLARVQAHGFLSRFAIIPGEGITTRTAGYLNHRFAVVSAGSGRRFRASGSSEGSGFGNSDAGRMSLPGRIGSRHGIIAGRQVGHAFAGEAGVAPVKRKRRFSPGHVHVQHGAGLPEAGDLAGLVQADLQGQDILRHIKGGSCFAAQLIGHRYGMVAGAQRRRCRFLFPVIPAEGIVALSAGYLYRSLAVGGARAHGPDHFSGGGEGGRFGQGNGGRLLLSGGVGDGNRVFAGAQARQFRFIDGSQAPLVGQRFFAASNFRQQAAGLFPFTAHRLCDGDAYLQRQGLFAYLEVGHRPAAVGIGDRHLVRAGSQSFDIGAVRAVIPGVGVTAGAASYLDFRFAVGLSRVGGGRNGDCCGKRFGRFHCQFGLRRSTGGIGNGKLIKAGAYRLGFAAGKSG